MKSLEFFTNFIVCSDSQKLGIPIFNRKVVFKTTKNKNIGSQNLGIPIINRKVDFKTTKNKNKGRY